MSRVPGRRCTTWPRPGSAQRTYPYANATGHCSLEPWPKDVARAGEPANRRDTQCHGSCRSIRLLLFFVVLYHAGRPSQRISTLFTSVRSSGLQLDSCRRPVMVGRTHVEPLRTRLQHLVPDWHRLAQILDRRYGRFVRLSACLTRGSVAIRDIPAGGSRTRPYHV